MHKILNKCFSNEKYIIIKIELNNILKIIIYNYISGSTIILFIFILMMIYELLPYFKKLTKNLNQHKI